MAMAYILMVNPGMFASLGNVSCGAIYIATALSAVVGTLLIGLLSNLPLAQASGMGLNAFFVYTVCFGLGFSYANALLFVLADGIIFVLLTVTGLRRLIFNAIPAPVKAAIPAGIGLFIAFLGFQDAGIVVNDSATCVGLVSLNLLGSATWGSIMPILVPACAYSAARIYIGTLMISCVRDIDWADPAVAVPSFLTLTVMPFTYNISYGIGFGLISYIFVRLFTGKAKEINAGTWIISAFFAATFLLTH